MNYAISQFVEQLGLVMELDGLPRVAGRIVGILMVSEEPLSLEELAEQLGVSKPSISVNARMLEERRIIVRIGQPGDRRDYYQIADDFMVRTMEMRMARWQRFHDVVAQARESLPIRSTRVRRRLAEFVTAKDEVRQLLVALLERWRVRASVALLLGVVASEGRAQQDPSRTLTLGEAAREAAVHGAAARIAGFRAEEFVARVRQRRADLLPNVSATWSDGQRTFNTASFGFALPGLDPNGEVRGPVRTVDVRGRVVAPLFDPAALGRLRSAQAAGQGAAAEARAVAEQAAGQAADAYVRALRAQAQVSARQADSTLASELLDIARSQLRAGVGIALDVTRAEAQLAGTRSQLIAARAESDRARLALLRAMGLPVTTRIRLADSLAASAPGAAVPDESAMIATALASRPDVRAAAAAVETSRRAVRAAKAERLPSLGLFADDGATSKSYTHLLNTYTYGFQLTLPVFDGFRRAGRVEEQGAVLNEAQLRERDLRDQVAMEVHLALLDLAAAREQVEAARERLRLGEQELGLAQARFRAGVASNADVITASLALTGARTLLNDALASQQAARVAVARAQGTVTALP